MQQSNQFSALRNFLDHHQVSHSLSLRLHRSAQNVLEQKKRNTSEADVELFKLVSGPLLAELHQEVNGPCVTQYPFMFYLNHMEPSAMRQVCHLGVSTSTAGAGDSLFSSGEMPEVPQMIFLVGGMLKYTKDKLIH